MLARGRRRSAEMAGKSCSDWTTSEWSALCTTLVLLSLIASQTTLAADVTSFGAFARGTFSDLHEPAFRAFARPGELKEASVLDLGTNFDSVDSGGHSLSTPYQFEHDLAGDSWRFYLQGSGFEWKAPSSGSTQFGFTDSTVIAMHPVLGDGKPWKLFAGASVTVPTHGQVGSTSAIEAGRLVLKDNLDDRWSVKLVGAEGYVNSVSRGAGNVASYVHGELHYVTTPKEDVYVALERQVQSGAGGASNAIVVYDFLFSKPLGKLTGGSIALTRGLTSQTRDKSAEFDLEWTF